MNMKIPFDTPFSSCALKVGSYDWKTFSQL